ncbi:MAG: hypothetical protein ACOVO0_10785 [Burkholderiaceae bacterium]
MKRTIVLMAAATLAGTAWAKLPPLSDEAKAKAAEAAAKAAHGGKVEAFLLCKSQNKVVAHYTKTASAASKDAKLPATPAACADPGPYVAAAPAGAAPVASAAPPAAPAVAAAPAAAAPKKP